MKKIAIAMLLILVSGCISTQKLPTEPRQLFLSTGEAGNFVYLNHYFSISYLSSFPMQKIELIIDGEKENISISSNTSCPGKTCVFSKKKGDITYLIQPVIWENKDGERTWSFGSWNTSEIYFQVIKN